MAENTSDPLAVGKIVPNDFILPNTYPQNVRSVYTAPEVSGAVKIIWNYSSAEHREMLIEIMFDSFLPIPQSDGIRIKQPESIHPSPYWAEPAFIAKIRALGEKFYAKTNKDITITDGSLLWGGRLDINSDWRAPHAEHRNGHQADIRIRDMTDAEQEIFRDICAEVGISPEVHQPSHWHIRG